MGKPRVRILLDGLRANGIEVIECRADVWSGIQDKSQVKGIWHWLRLLARIVLAYPSLLVRYLRLPRHDWVLLGYPAIPDIFVLRLFAWLRRTPVAMDWFLSAYDTVVLDRRIVSRRHPLALILYCVEWLAARTADCVFMDTRTHAERMGRLFHLPQGRIGSVWVGAEIDNFPWTANEPKHPDAVFTVLFYGQFIPLHGIPTIIKAAQLLQNENIQWVIIGRGQESSRIEALLAQYPPLHRLSWIDWVHYEDLIQWLQRTDVCLGIFGASDKAASVIPNKVFQVLASGRPLITRDSPAIRELLHDDMPCVRLIEADSPHALAEAIHSMRSVRETADGSQCHADLRPHIGPAAIASQLITLLTRAMR